MHQRHQTGNVAEAQAGNQARFQSEPLTQVQGLTRPDEVARTRHLLVEAIQAAVGRDHPVA